MNKATESMKQALEDSKEDFNAMMSQDKNSGLNRLKTALYGLSDRGKTMFKTLNTDEVTIVLFVLYWSVGYSLYSLFSLLFALTLLS